MKSTKQLKNYQLITVKYLGATNTRGSRVKLIDNRFKVSIMIPFNYSLNDINDMAAEYLRKRGHKIAGQVEIGLILEANGKEKVFKSIK